MESTFTKFPEPVGDTETSWKDNVDYESEFSKKWTGDEKLALPTRTAPGRYPHYPDYSDADFEVNSAEGTCFSFECVASNSLFGQNRGFGCSLCSVPLYGLLCLPCSHIAQIVMLIVVFYAVAHLRSREQRYRERFVAIAEMRLLQDELRICFAKNTVNAHRLCRPLAQEYLRRLKCPLYVCDHDVCRPFHLPRLPPHFPLFLTCQLPPFHPLTLFRCSAMA